MSGPLDFGSDDRERPAAPAGDPPPEPGPPRRAAGASRYTWFLGVVAFLLLAVVSLNAITTEGVQTGGPAAGNRLAPFAVPVAASSLDGDANVATPDTAGDQAGRRPACEVRGPDIVNICELAERGPVALALFAADGACLEVLEQFDRVAPRAGDVQLVAVGSRGERDRLRGRHPYPVGWDRDGAVATVYGLVTCPQISFAERGGRVVETTRSELTDAELVERLERLGR